MSNDQKTTKVRWKVHVPNLLAEMMNNNDSGILTQPVYIFAHILDAVGKRAAQLNDPVLNDLMCRLTIYEIADPESPGYDRDRVAEIEALAYNYKDDEPQP